MFCNQYGDFIDLDPDWIRIQSIRIHITDLKDHMTPGTETWPHLTNGISDQIIYDDLQYTPSYDIHEKLNITDNIWNSINSNDIL